MLIDALQAQPMDEQAEADLNEFLQDEDLKTTISSVFDNLGSQLFPSKNDTKAERTWDLLDQRLDVFLNSTNSEEAKNATADEHVTNEILDMILDSIEE